MSGTNVLWPHKCLDAMKSEFIYGESDEQPHAFGHVSFPAMAYVDGSAAFSG